MKVRIKKLHHDAIVPTYGTAGAACFDLYALGTGVVGDGMAEVFRTGLSFEIPHGYAMMIYSRSGHGFKHGVRLANCVGVIDSDYRGEVMVKLASDSVQFMHVNARDRIAQAMIVPVDQVQFELADDLSDTARGEGGFGSTGA